MASPFHVFRKNQKVLIVIVGLMAMISFVILAPLMGVIGDGSGGPGNNPLVLTSSYGDLRKSDVEHLRLQQSILYNFLNTADQERWIADGRDPSTWQPTRPGQVDDDYAIQTYLLANKADEMGIVVDDNVINHMLGQYNLGSDRIREMVSGYQMGNGPMTVRQLFEAYRIDIKASRVRQAYGLAVPGRPRTSPPTIYTPEQSFENFRQLNDQVQIEAVAVPVDDFVEQVKKEPTEDELVAFYEKHKDQLDVPLNVGGVQMAAPEPGFKLPPKASFHYLEGNYHAYIDLAKQQVTDEEIKQYYEDNKRQFEKLNLLDAPGEGNPSGLDLKLPELGAPPELDSPSSAPSKSPEKPASKEAEKASESTEEKPPAEEDKTETKTPAAEEKPAKAEQPAAEKADPQKPAADRPAEESPEAKEKEPRSALQKDSLEGLVLSTEIPTQFVNLQDDPEGTPKEEEPAKSPEEKSAEEKQPESKEPAEPNTEDSQPEKAQAETETDEQPKSETPAKQESAPAENEKDASADSTPSDPAADPEKETDLDVPAAVTPKSQEATKEPPKQYKPLEEVEEEIRETLAEQRAGLNMLDAMEPLKEELDNYWNRTTQRKLTEGEKDVAELPPGFLEKAEKSHLVFKETQFPLSYFQLSEIPLGQATVPMDAGVPGFSNVPLAQYAFLGQMKPFQAVMAEHNDGTKYLAWKVSDSEERVPKLDEIRDEVVLAWKRMEARKLAEAEAKRLAEKAQKAAAPLDRALGDEDYAVQFSSPFTWLTRGAAHQFDFNPQLRLGEISGVTGADNDFMKAIFALKEGEITSLMNFPQDTAYVVRLSGRVIPVQELRNQYLREEAMTPAFFRAWDRMAQQEVMSEINDALMAEVERQANVKYLEQVDGDELVE